MQHLQRAIPTQHHRWLMRLIGSRNKTSTDPVEMPRSVALHLRLHCLPKHPVYKGLST